jgi:hypothetical protein
MHSLMLCTSCVWHISIHCCYLVLAKRDFCNVYILAFDCKTLKMYQGIHLYGYLIKNAVSCPQNNHPGAIIIRRKCKHLIQHQVPYTMPSKILFINVQFKQFKCSFRNRFPLLFERCKYCTLHSPSTKRLTKYEFFFFPENWMCHNPVSAACMQ